MFGWLKNADSGHAEAIAAAIGKSQAVIEFRMDGTIVKANENFLNAVATELVIMSCRSGEAICTSSSRLMIEPASSSTAGMWVVISTTRWS